MKTVISLVNKVAVTPSNGLVPVVFLSHPTIYQRVSVVKDRMKNAKPLVEFSKDMEQTAMKQIVALVWLVLVE